MFVSHSCPDPFIVTFLVLKYPLMWTEALRLSYAVYRVLVLYLWFSRGWSATRRSHVRASSQSTASPIAPSSWCYCDCAVFLHTLCIRQDTVRVDVKITTRLLEKRERERDRAWHLPTYAARLVLFISSCRSELPSATSLHSKTSFSPSLLATNFLSFCLSGNVFISHFWKIVSPDTEVLLVLSVSLLDWICWICPSMLCSHDVSAQVLFLLILVSFSDLTPWGLPLHLQGLVIRQWLVKGPAHTPGAN